MDPTATCPVRSHDIALVGVGCKFPGGITDTESFWKKILEGVDGVVEVPKDRWDAEALYDKDPSKPGKTYTRAGGFIDNVFKFDPEFFNVSPREASYWDPQQRILLHAAYEALEDAGMGVEGVQGSKCGVFMGVMNVDWNRLALWDHHAIQTYTGLGSMTGGLANRLSFLMNLRGPSVTLDTLCSSGLNAVHLACNSLRGGECNVAFAGGVNLMISPDVNMAFGKAMLLSKSSGPSRAFDAKADGYCRGEGVGVILLKRLEDAVSNNDHIYAVIKGTASNHDGTKRGFTVPSSQAQQMLMRDILQKTSTPPHTIQYVEAHGTGTAVGDPIEMNAIGTIFGNAYGRESDVIVGSIKANIGHTEAASGLAGIIKLSLSLKNEMIPPNIHFEDPNPNIPFTNLRLRVLTKPEAWPETNNLFPRTGFLNNFGAGGSNAAAMIQQPPTQTKLPPTEITTPLILPLSAHTPTSLSSIAKSFLQLFENFEKSKNFPALSDLIYTATQRKTHHKYRLALVGKTYVDFITLLKDYCANTSPNSYTTTSTQAIQQLAAANEQPGLARGVRGGIVFVFCGMGPQWYAMGRELLKSEKIFRSTVEEIDRALRNAGGSVSILDELQNSEEKSSRINESIYAQPCIFAVQVGLAALWKSFGVVPDMVVGHSFGEIAAATVSGALSITQAAGIVYHRSRLLQTMRGTGVMMAVGVPIDRAEKICAEKCTKYNDTSSVVIAAINGPSSVTLAGKENVIRELHTEMEAEGLFARMMNVDIPFHSPILAPIEREYIESITPLLKNSYSQFNKAKSPLLISSVTGELLPHSQCLDPHHWVRNMMQPVRFMNAFGEILNYRGEGGVANVVLEVGPHPVLAPSIKECTAHFISLDSARKVPLRCSIKRKEPERIALLQTLSFLYAEHFAIPRWEKLGIPNGNFIRELPTYANTPGAWQFHDYADIYKDSPYWNSIYYGLKNNGMRATNEQGELQHYLLGCKLPTALPIWQSSVQASDVEYMNDHLTLAGTVYPAAAYADMMLAVATSISETTTSVIQLANIKLEQALFLPASSQESFTMQTSYCLSNKEVVIHSKSAEVTNEWKKHVSAEIKLLDQVTFDSGVTQLEEFKQQCTTPLDKLSVYWMMRLVGLKYGKYFQLINSAWTGDNMGVAKIVVSPELVEKDTHAKDHVFHPAVFDACLHSCFLAVSLSDLQVSYTGGGLYLPVFISSVKLLRKPIASEAGDTLYSCVKRRFNENDKSSKSDSSSVIIDLLVFDKDGLVMEGTGLQCKSLRENIEPDYSKWLQNYKWIEAPTICETSNCTSRGMLIFGDKSVPSVSHLIDHYRKCGNKVICVEKKKQFVKCSSEEFKVKDHKDFALVLSDLKQSNQLSCVTDVIWMWGISRDNTPHHDTVEEITEQIMSIASIMQENEKINLGHSIRAWCVTSMVNVIPKIDSAPSKDITLASYQGAIWSFIRSAAQVKVWQWFLADLPLGTPTSNDLSVLVDYIDGGSEQKEEEVAIRNGKLLIPRMDYFSMPEENNLFKDAMEVDSPSDVVPAQFPDPQGAYIITGGLGGIGFAICKWLVEQGARHVTLTGRSPPSTSISDEIEEMNSSYNARVVVELGDVADFDSCSDMVKRASTRAPLAGVFHVAAVMPFLSVMSENEINLKAALAAKTIGALNLHRITLDIPSLKTFVLISSIASLIGERTSAAYGAANGALDALARHRKLHGLPSLALNFGQMYNTGKVKTNLQYAVNLESLGFFSFHTRCAFEIMGKLIRAGGRVPNREDVPSGALIAPIDWNIVTSRIKVASLTSMASSKEANVTSNKQDLATRIREMDDSTAQSEVQTCVRKAISEVMGTKPDYDLQVSISSFGMDSLMNMELRGKLSNLGVNIPLAKIMEGPTIFELSETILNMLRSSSSKQANPPSPATLARNERKEQEQKQQNEQQQVVTKPSFIQEHFVKVYAESGSCNDCHLAGLLSFASIDPEILQLALNQLIEREIALRTRFDTSSPSSTKAVVVTPHLAQYKIPFFDYTKEEEQFDKICDDALEDAKKPFDLSKAPLLRAHLYKYSEGYVVYTVVHHAVLDGVAMLVLWRSLFTTYHAIAESKKDGSLLSSALSPSISSYSDYVDMEAKYLNSDKYTTDSSFWKQYLHNMQPLQLPSGVGEHSFKASKMHFVIPSDLICRLSTLLNQRNLTMYQITITAYMLTLSRLYNQCDVTIGTTISTRYHSASWRDMLGNFINDVAMRINFSLYNSKQMSLLDLLLHVRNVHSSILDHTSFPVYTLAQSLFPSSTLTRNPLYKAMFLFQSQTSSQQINPDTLTLSSLSLQKERCREILDLGESLFDLTMELMPPVKGKGEEEIEGEMYFSNNLFSTNTIQNMVRNFLEILEDFASASESERNGEVNQKEEVVKEEEEEEEVYIIEDIMEEDTKQQQVAREEVRPPSFTTTTGKRKWDEIDEMGVNFGVGGELL